MNEKEVTQQVKDVLSGLPSKEESMRLYHYYSFDRSAIADHLKITNQQLYRLQKRHFGDDNLPSGPSYTRQYNERDWFETVHPEWTFPRF